MSTYLKCPVCWFIRLRIWINSTSRRINNNSSKSDDGGPTENESDEGFFLFAYFDFIFIRNS